MDTTLDRVLTQYEVMKLLRLTAETIRRYEKAGRFPPRIRLNPDPNAAWSRAGWRKSEIDRWIDERRTSRAVAREPLDAA